MNSRDRNANGRARPPGAPGRPQRKKLPHERPLWLRPEDEIFFITVCCEPRGKNQLCYSNIARAIFDSVEFRNQNAVWYAHLVCLMPDHLHALISFPYERPMRQIVADWKRFLATKLTIEWQRDLCDHPSRQYESDFFSNGANARRPPAHTVARGDAHEDTAFYTGQTKGTYVTQLPVKLTRDLMIRGREHFDAICAECHDRTGSGNGMVVQRGFPQPPSFHVDRLRNAPIGHFFDVTTNGYGVMYSYATRVEPEARWAIAAYIRALQLSHNAR